MFILSNTLLFTAVFYDYYIEINFTERRHLKPTLIASPSPEDREGVIEVGFTSHNKLFSEQLSVISEPALGGQASNQR